VKQRLIVAISLVVFVVDRFRETICRLVGKRVPATWVVLYYHSIPREKRSAFAKQMDELIRRSRPVRLDARLPRSFGVRYVSVTFDDGYQNIIDYALPELEQRGIPTTLFIVSGALGCTPGWEDYSASGDPAMNDPIMGEDQLRKLSPDLVQIGSHTRTHPMLTRLSEQEARSELSLSRTRLQEILKRDIKLFSFPYGAFNSDLVAWCSEEGYEKVFTTLPYAPRCDANEFTVGRVTVDPDDGRLVFSLKLSGAYRWWPYAIVLKKKVVSRIKFKTYEKDPELIP